MDEISGNIKRINVCDSEHYIGKLKAKSTAEGAQAHYDIDFGSYPFVTSSNTVCAGACTGLELH